MTKAGRAPVCAIASFIGPVAVRGTVDDRPIDYHDSISGYAEQVATFIRAVDQLRARKFGARIMEVPSMAMVEGVTLTTTTTYVKNHEHEVRALILAMIDATHFFKTKKAETLAIIKEHCTQLLKMQNDEEWDCFYDTQSASLEEKPYPSIEAIQNVFALALKRDPEIKDFNPLTLWDLHYVKEIDDSGYIQKLCQ